MQLVVQVFQSQFSIALAPLAEGHACQAHALGNRYVGFASTNGQHNLEALDDPMRK